MSSHDMPQVSFNSWFFRQTSDFRIGWFKWHVSRTHTSSPRCNAYRSVLAHNFPQSRLLQQLRIDLFKHAANLVSGGNRIIVVLATRRCAAWASTLTTHKHPPKEQEIKGKKKQQLEAAYYVVVWTCGGWKAVESFIRRWGFPGDLQDLRLYPS